MMIDAAFFLCPGGIRVSEWRSEGGRGCLGGGAWTVVGGRRRYAGGVQRILASPPWSRVTAAPAGPPF
eukprot:4475885-Prymnesium_polylepis.1